MLTVYVVCLAFIFLIRPIVGYFSLGKLGMSRNERWVTAALGIRGIGTLYYIAYACLLYTSDAADE